VRLQQGQLGKSVVQPVDGVAVQLHSRFAQFAYRLDREHPMPLAGEPRRIAAGAGTDIGDSHRLAREEIADRGVNLLGRERIVAGYHLGRRRRGIAGQDIVHLRFS
jgi:hypothetical protein